MRSVLLSLSLSVMLIGCGGSDPMAYDTHVDGGPGDPPPALVGAGFVGAWKGNAIYGTSTCSDGSTSPAQSSAFTLNIAQVSDGKIDFPITLGTNPCGRVGLSSLTGITANQTFPLTCAPYTYSGWVITTTLSQAALQLNSGALAFSIHEQDVMVSTVDGTQGTCTRTTTGTFTK